MTMELIKRAVKVGNSAGVILPRKLLGSEVKITVISRPFDLRKAVLKLLSPFLKDIIGIFIINKKPLEVLAISSSIKEKIQNDRFSLAIVPLFKIRKDLINNQILKQKIENAETILNKSLLETLKFEAKGKVRTKL